MSSWGNGLHHFDCWVISITLFAFESDSVMEYQSWKKLKTLTWLIRFSVAFTAKRPPVEETASFLQSLLASHGPNYLEKLFGSKARDALAPLGGVEKVAIALSESQTIEGKETCWKSNREKGFSSQKTPQISGQHYISCGQIWSIWDPFLWLSRTVI